jgi:hypothetical protein
MNYGKHMTAEEVVDFFAPHQSSTDAVAEWLVASGITSDRYAISANKQVLPLTQILFSLSHDLFNAENANGSN